MLIAGLAGTDSSCADTMGADVVQAADKVQARIAATRIEVFIAVFLQG
jgi:hypothetical protein